MIEALLVGLAALAVGVWLGWRARGTRARLRRHPDLEHTRSELTRRLNELFSFQELSYVLSDSIEPKRVAEQAAAHAARFIDCDGTLVAVGGEDPKQLRVVAAEGLLAHLVGVETQDESAAGLVGEAMARKQLVVAEPKAGEHPVLIAGMAVRRAAIAPLRAHGVTSGALVVVRDSDMTFRQEDLRLLSTAATHTAMALANARFVELVQAGKEQWETTFDALADGVAVVGPQGCIRRANRALAGLLDRPLPDVIGMELCQALGQPAELAERLGAARAGVQLPPLTCRSGNLNRTLRVTASPMGGAVREGWVVALIEDVTEQKALEAQLIQSEKMAAVGHLVSGVAHELNNPLTSISGLAEFLMQREGIAEREREHLGVIHEQAERAGRIVQNLLTFARKGPTDVTDVDLNHVVRGAAALITYELRLRKIEFEIELADDLPLIRGDRYHIQQVALNLLTNAVHAVSENPQDRDRLVSVGTTLENGEIVLRIADTGPGIPDDLLPKVFDPFFTTKDTGEGTGLGLWVTYGIVEGHGGRIEVQRRTEGGTVFTVTLPRAPTHRGAAGAEQPKPPDAARPPKGCKILLVDDDPAVREMIDVLFTHEGQLVEAASDAAHAVDLLAQNAYDMVLADARAAVSAGETFAEVLCNRFPQLRERTIFLTADVRPETDAWLNSLGCRYFHKPFNARELRAAAAEILSATTRPG